MPVDGSLIFDTAIDTEGFEKDARKLERSADDLGRTVEQQAKEFSSAFRIDGVKKMNSQILKLQNSIKQSQAKIMRLRTELVELENTPVYAKQIENAQEKVREYEKEFFDLLNQREAFEEEFKKGLPEFVSRKEAQEIVETSREWQKMTTQIDKAEKRLEKYEKRLENVLAKEEDPRGTNAYKNRQEQIQKLIDNIAVYEMRIAELSDSIEGVDFENGEGDSIFDRLKDVFLETAKKKMESLFLSELKICCLAVKTAEAFLIESKNSCLQVRMEKIFLITSENLFLAVKTVKMFLIELKISSSAAKMEEVFSPK